MKALAPFPDPTPEQGASDPELVGRVLAGEKELYALLMRRHNQRVFRTTRALLGNDDEAEDVVQHAYVTAYRKLATFRGESSFATWLTSICINEAKSRMRQGGKHPTVTLLEGGAGATEMPDPADTPEEAASRSELSSLLEAYVDGLPENLRVVFVLRDAEELSTEETAELLQISCEAVRVRLHRARKLLEERLSRAMAQAPGLYRFDGERCDRIVASVRARLGI